MTDLMMFDCCRANPVEADEVAGPMSFLGPLEGPSPMPCGAPRGTTEARPRSWRTAVHESAHAVVGIALGCRISSVTIDEQPLCWFAAKQAYPANVIVDLAGSTADHWTDRMVSRISDAQLAVWIAGIRDFKGGYCDQCCAVRSSIIGTGHAADDVVLAEFRRLESLALKLVRHPRVWPAILDLAGALMKHGTVEGDAAAAICACHSEPGFFLAILNQE